MFSTGPPAPGAAQAAEHVSILVQPRVPFLVPVLSPPAGHAGTPVTNARVAAVDRVVRLLHLLDGHVRGDFPAHGVLRGRADLVEVIEATLPSTVAPYAVRLLQHEHGALLRTAAPDAAAASRSCLTVAERLRGCRLELQVPEGGRPLTIVLAPHARFEAPRHTPPVMFDWQLLAVTRQRMYLADHPALPPGDGLAAAAARCHQRVFCLALLPGRQGEDAAAAPQHPMTAPLQASAMLHATQLVQEGWRMDDRLCGRQAWVLGRWGRMQATPHLCRAEEALLAAPAPAPAPLLPPQQQPPAAAPRLAKYTNCPLCYEHFQPSDVVINLACNHNFHTICVAGTRPDGGPKPGGGLCAWVATGKLTCPCCRTSF